MYFDCVLKSAHISWWGIILECSFQSLRKTFFIADPSTGDRCGNGECVLIKEG